MLVLEKMSTAEELTRKQLDAIQARAIAVWGEKFWISKLAAEYKKVSGSDTDKDAVVRRWFKGGTSPNLESFNNLLLATGCKMAIECPEQVIQAQKIL